MNIKFTLGKTEVDENNLVDLLEAERLLVNSNLKLYICEKVVEMLTIKNCCFYLELSKLFCLKDLRDFLYNNIFQCYLTKFNLRLFYELSFKDLLILISSELQTDSELEVFNSIVDWINYKESERKIYIDKLLKFVRLPLLTKEIIVNVVKAHPLCSNNLNCRTIIDKALEIKKNKHQFLSSIFLQNRYYGRKIDNKEIMFIGGKHEKTTKDSFKPLAASYKIDSLGIIEIKRSSVMNEQIKRCISLVIGTKIYCLGGCDCDDFNEVFQVYCRRTDKWKSLDQHPHYGGDFCACSFMGKIYVFGKAFSTISFVYDPEKNSWKRIADTINKRECSSCTVFQGQCTVVGGDTSCNVFSKSVESYDHHLNKWSLLPDLQVGRKLPGLLAKGNKLYVIAGAYSNTHEVYDSLTKQFTFIAPNSDFMFFHCFLFANGNNVFVLRSILRSALDSADNTNVRIPTYDIVDNKWHTTTMNFVGSLRIDLFGYSIVTLQNYLK